MAKKKKIVAIDFDDYLDLGVNEKETPKVESEVESKKKVIEKEAPKEIKEKAKKYVNTKIEAPKSGTLDLEDYLYKNEDVSLKHIHVDNKAKRKLMKACEILGINQYDLATNIIMKFFEEFGKTIKEKEEDVL